MSDNLLNIALDLPAEHQGAIEPVVQAEPLSQLSPGEALSLARHDLLPPKQPTLRYLVLSPQRTGSNYLCRRLCNVRGRFGLPTEYLNPQITRMIVPRILPGQPVNQLPPLGRYMAALERIRTSEDGLFGIKVQPEQLYPHTGRTSKAVLGFVGQFDRLVLITRRDKLGQAISGALAQATEKWFNDGSTPVLNPQQRQRIMPLIANNLARYMVEEQVILDMGRQFAKPMLRVEYEDIEADGQAVFLEVADFLTGSAAGELAEAGALPVPEKAGGALAAELRAHFLDRVQGLTAR
jgi:LPS sulfotransferase NodH